MGFLDTIREKLNLNQDEDYYEDDYDDFYEEDVVEEEPQRDTSGILGNTRRPEAESVSVYTRSGRPVSNNAGAASAGDGYAVGSEAYEPDYRGDNGYRSDPYGAPRSAQSTGYGTTAPGDAGLTAVPRMSAAQLPPYVLKPVAYDDVQMVVRRVRTNQPVVLSFKNTNIEVAKRILDFCFGLSCGIGGNVEELGDRAFVVLPAGIELSQSDLAKLAADGVITR